VIARHDYPFAASSPYPRNRGARQAMVSVTRIFLGLLASVLGAGALAAAWAWFDGPGAGRVLVAVMSPSYDQAGHASGRPLADPGTPQDIAIELTSVAEGFNEPTDVQFPPGVADRALVLEKGGAAHWLVPSKGTHGRLLKVQVLTASEEGLLGAAFHPAYANNGRVFLHYVAEHAGKHMSRVEEWRFEPPGDLLRAKARAVRLVIEQEQPYQNHNGGGLAFGPDGYLYIGYGDGGFRDDPHGHAQNPKTWLGSMLRIDIDGADDKRAYRVPSDNPFVGKDGFAPETYAYGLRNPWRYSFDPKGRLIVADVGQDRWEELDIVLPGDNLGWKVREGFACAERDKKECPIEGAVDPIHVYPRTTGTSITGGFVYLGKRIAALHGKYVFGDFTSGRIFALELPDPRAPVERALSLGKFHVLISAFGRDASGELYVASFGNGRILRLDPKQDAPKK
jgi:glucose/arabinose dehydrogenase